MMANTAHGHQLAASALPSLFLALLMHGTVAAAASPAAEDVIWAVPPPVLRVDFAAAEPETPPRFLADGAAWEFPLGFTLAGRERVTIEAHLPEPGKFEFVQTNPAAQVEIRRQPPAGAIEKTEVLRTWKFKTMKDLGQEADKIALQALEQQRLQARQEMADRNVKALQAYLRKVSQLKTPVPEQEQDVRDLYEKVRAVELGPDVLRACLTELADRRGAWVTAEERKAWDKASGFELMRDYGRLLTLDLADKYLADCGFQRETEQNFATVIGLKVAGIEAFAAGRSLDPKDVDARQAVKAAAQDLGKVRAALTVLAQCRYYLPADPEDPNSQWFHAQRVVCAARNLASVTVSGALDPSHHDRADWWTLVEYDPAWVRLEFPSVADVSYQVYPDGERRYRLRAVSAGGGPVRYGFTLHARTVPADGKHVEVHESAVKAITKFPF